MTAGRAGVHTFAVEVMIYAAGGAAQRAALLLLLPILGRMLSADEYGGWSIFIALLPMLGAIVDFGVSKAIGHFYFEHDSSDASLGGFLARAIWLRFAVFAALTLPILFGLYVGWPLLTGSKLPRGAFISALFIACVGEGLILAITAFSRARRITSVFAVLRLGQGALTVALAYLFARTHGLLGAAMGLTIGNTVTAIWGLGWARTWISRQSRVDAPLARFDGAWQMVRYGAPGAAHDLSWWARNSSTLIVLSHFATADLVGAYAMGFAALSVVTMLSWSLDFATVPYYYAWRKDEADWRANTRDTLALMDGLIFVIASAGILFFADLRAALFGTKFAEADAVAPLLLIAGMLQPLYFMTVKPYFYLQRTSLLSRITFLTSTAVVGGTILTVWQFGYIAAGAMTIVSYSGIAVIGYWLSLSLEPSPFKLGYALYPCVACCLLATLVLAFNVPLTLRITGWIVLVAAASRWRTLKSLRALSARHAF